MRNFYKTLSFHNTPAYGPKFNEDTNTRILPPQSAVINISMTNTGNQVVQARDIIGSSVVSGDHNAVSTRMTHVVPPPADRVDVKAELVMLRGILAELKKVADRAKLDRAVEDAVEEATKPEPDKQEVGGALERAVKYAKAAGDFGEHIEEMLPRLAALVSWLGANGHTLLSMLAIST
jgi:hypothetical protein